MNGYLTLVVAAIVAACTWMVASDHYGKQMAEQDLEWQTAYTAAANSALAERDRADELKRNAEVQHGKDQLHINRLASEFDRVRVHLPTCGGKREAGTAGQGGDGGDGVFSNRVDEGFGRLQERAGRLFQRCDQLNIDTRRLNAAIGD